MAWNPRRMAFLEARGLTDEVLERMELALLAETDGSVGWHYVRGFFVKFEMHQFGLMPQTKPLPDVTKRYRS